MGEETQTTENAGLVPQMAPRSAVEVGGRPGAMIPRNLPEAMQVASMIANSGMVPKAFQEKNGSVNPGRVLVGIMAGAEVGLAPFQSLQSIAVIGNMPALWGDGALALVQSSGLCADMDEQWDEQRQVATCIMQRVGRASPIIREFGMEDAKKAGLAGKDGPWLQYPKRMCQMRARSWAMRDGFADVLKGLAIAEEAQDIPATDGGQIEGQKVKIADLRTQAAPTALSADDEASPADDAAFLRGESGETAAVDALTDDGAISGVDTATDDNPAATEGRSDDEHGDQHDGTDQAGAAEQFDPDSPSEKALSELLHFCKHIKKQKHVDETQAKFAICEPGLSIDQIRRFEAEFNAAKARISQTK